MGHYESIQNIYRFCYSLIFLHIKNTKWFDSVSLHSKTYRIFIFPMMELYNGFFIYFLCSSSHCAHLTFWEKKTTMWQSESKYICFLIDKGWWCNEHHVHVNLPNPRPSTLPRGWSESWKYIQLSLLPALGQAGSWLESCSWIIFF